MSMPLNATRSPWVVSLLFTATGCGQDLDLGPLTGGDDLSLPPPGPSSAAGNACAFETAAAVPLPDRCLPYGETAIIKTEDVEHVYRFFSEVCLVSSHVQALDFQQNIPACPVGIYLKFAPDSWRQPGPPLPGDGALPSPEAFERAVGLLRSDQPRQMWPDNWKAPFTSEGWNAVPRSVQVLPEQRAVFVRFDPRPSTGQRFFLMLGLTELLSADHRDFDPDILWWALDVAPGAAPVIE
jgi:hypothetical protein